MCQNLTKVRGLKDIEIEANEGSLTFDIELWPKVQSEKR